MLDNVTKDEEKVLIQKLVHDLLNDQRTNAWEKEFLVSINDQLLVRDLSEKQLSVLNKIKKKYKNSTQRKVAGSQHKIAKSGNFVELN